jgi:NAD(P)-dependent dehydrogenase (short-subunit alcohol dehydrogenase family)
MESKVAVITGATSGIGLAILELLSKKGFVVEGVGRSAEKVERLGVSLGNRSEGNSVGLRVCDIRDIAAVRALVGHMMAEHGRIDALVNSAGVLKLENTHDVTEASFAEQCDTLFRGTFFLTTAVLPHMIAAGGGTIVNIGSVAAEKASPKMAVYAAAKAALASFTKTVALEYCDKHIRTVCIQPGAVETNLIDKIVLAMIQKKTPLKRLAQPAEIAGLVSYLLSAEASYITGSTINIDGGSGL